MVTVHEAMHDYLLASRSLARRTQEWYAEKLGQFERWCDSEGVSTIEALRAVHLRLYQDHLSNLVVDDASKRHASKPLSPYTVRGAVQVIKGWSRWLLSEDYLGGDPFAKVKRVKAPQKVIETFTPEHIQALLGACPKHTPLGMRDRAIVLVLLDTGLRVSELCGMLVEHVHLQDREPWLEVAWQTSKGKKAREVGIGTEAARALTRYLRFARPSFAKRGEEHVWLSRWGQAMTRNGVDQALYDLRDRAGADLFRGVRVSAHTLRHSFAVTFLKATGDVYRLSRSLGHNSVQVTEVYLRAYRARDARNAWVSAADQLLRG